MLLVTLKILLFHTQILRKFFLPKNTTSRLQPLEAGIIRNFKVKYQKRVLKLFISRIDDNRKASEFIQEVDVLKAITSIVTNCFPKCCFRNKAQHGVVQTLDQDEDEKFDNVVKEFAGDVDPDDYVDLDKDTASSMVAVDADSIFWRQEIRK